MDSGVTTSVDLQSSTDVNARQVQPDANTNGNGRRNVKSANVAKPQKTEKPLQNAGYRHLIPAHSRTRPTCLSHDSAQTPSFLGFRNLMVIVLVVGNLRLVLENLQKYGVLICIRCHNYKKSDVLIGILLYILIPCHLMAAYLIELAAAQQAKGSRRAIKEGQTGPSEDDRRKFRSTWILIAWAHGINITLALAITTAVVYFGVHHPLIGTSAQMHAIIVWLKTASYALTNRDLRHAYLHPNKDQIVPELYAELPYPQNVTLGNLIYFWWAPTLVYQPVYPRTDKIRWTFVAKRVGEVICLSVFIWFLSAQYAAPTLQNSLVKIQTFDIPSIVERLLKVSTISLVIWLAGFFAFFQSALNALAEITRFGDRSFYDDWWNSESVGAYWRTWNKPVYNFFKRHVFVPMVARGWSPRAASVAVFIASAVLHEVLVGVPTHNILGVAFMGMILQIPLIFMTTPMENMKLGHTGKLLGNAIFWVSFTIFGQPFAALMYFYAWQAKYGSVSNKYNIVKTTQ